MKISLIAQTTVTTEIDYEVLPGIGDWAAYEMSIETKVTKGKSKGYGKSLNNSTLTEGFSKVSSIDKYINGKTKNLETPNLVCFTDDFYEKLRTYGLTRIMDMSKNMNIGITREWMETCQIRKPLEKIRNGMEISSRNLSQIDWGNQIVRSAEGDLIPMGIELSGAYGFNGENADLQKIVEIISCDPRITFFDSSGKVFRSRNRSDYISVIPFYPDESESGKMIDAVFSPTKEDMRRIDTLLKEWNVKDGYDFTQKAFSAILSLNLLGLPAGVLKEGLSQCRELENKTRRMKNGH